MPLATLISPPPGNLESRVLRLATLDDLPSLIALEHDCFDPDRRDTRSTIRKSLVNSQYETWIESCPSDQEIGAAIFLRKVRHTLRVYSLSTHPGLRGQGWGNLLLAFARNRALARGCTRLSLEADSSHPLLIDWYERKGFKREKFLEDYYEQGHHAWRMRRAIAQSE